MEKLLAALETVYKLPEAARLALAGAFIQASYAKGKSLHSPGSGVGRFYFVAKGALHVYRDVEEMPHTAWVAFEGGFFTEYFSYLRQEPTQFYVQALEDTEAWYMERSAYESLRTRYPELTSWFAAFWQQTLLQVTEYTLSLQAEAASSRYERFTQDRRFLTRLPLQHLATWMGVTPSTLSRLRRPRRIRRHGQG